MQEGLRARYSGHLLTLGRQEIVASRHEIREQASRLEYGLNLGVDIAKDGPISDDTFFRALGFDAVSSLDATNYEGATFIHDLNRQEVPSELESRFDVIIYRGTSEHVFHIPNLLGSIG